jgi:hypothetical protein
LTGMTQSCSEYPISKEDQLDKHFASEHKIRRRE